MLQTVFNDTVDVLADPPAPAITLARQRPLSAIGLSRVETSLTDLIVRPEVMVASGELLNNVTANFTDSSQPAVFGSHSWEPIVVNTMQSQSAGTFDNDLSYISHSYLPSLLGVEALARWRSVSINASLRNVFIGAKVYSDFSNFIRLEMKRRLNALQQDLAADGLEMSSASVTDFWSFVMRDSALLRPHMSATDAGTVRAIWKNSSREQVALHFLGGGRVNYVLFYRQDNEIRREYAEDNLEHAVELLSDKKLWRLLRNEG